jgi:hypothetical protein
MSMASPSALAEVDLSEEVVRGRVLRTFQGDVPDFFYRVLIPHFLSRFFTFPLITASELIAFARSRGTHIPEPPAGSNFCCLIVLSMGWSWAPFFAQMLLEEALEKAGAEYGADARVIDRGPTPSFIMMSLLLWVFIDDYLGAILEPCDLSLEDSRVKEEAARVKGVLNKQDIPIHKEEFGEGAKATIGVQITESPHVIRPIPNKMRELMMASAFAARMRLVLAEEIRILIGGWTWFFMTSRMCFSIFGSIYAFVHKNLEKGRVPWWPSARQELICAISMGPCVKQDMTRKLSDRVFMSDASLEGFGAVDGRFPLVVIR